MKKTVFLVVQPSLSHYREPLVRALMRDPRVNFEFAARNVPPGANHTNRNRLLAASADLFTHVTQLTSRKLIGHVVWDSGLLSATLKSRADLFVLEGSIYDLSTWVSTIILRAKRRKVAFWGHGWKRPETGIKLAFRKLFYRLANAHYVYGSTAVEYGMSVGIKNPYWHVVYNSIYSEACMDYQPRHSSEGEPLSLIFSGRLSERHGVESLVDAVVRLRRTSARSVHLTVIGDGSEMDALKAAAADDAQAVSFVGPVYEFEALKAYYRKAHFAVSPGASGLNVIQALSFGVPVIAAEGNPDSGPEIEAVEHLRTGLLFKGNVEGSLDAMLGQASAMTVHDRTKLGVNGMEVVRARYTSEQHAAAMVTAITHTIAGTLNDR